MLLNVVSSGSPFCTCSVKHTTLLRLHTSASQSLSGCFVRNSSRSFPTETQPWAALLQAHTGTVDSWNFWHLAVFFFFFSGAHLPVFTIPQGLTTVHTLDLPVSSWFCSVTILSRLYRSASLGYTHRIPVMGHRPLFFLCAFVSANWLFSIVGLHCVFVWIFKGELTL